MYFIKEARLSIDPSEPEIKRKSLRSLLWFGMISITMLFAGLTSAYLVRQGEGKWVEFALPKLFIVSSLIIILSSLTIQFGLFSIKKKNTNHLKIAMLFTFILGCGFVISQYYAWSELYSNGIAFTGRIMDIKTDFHYVPAGSETAAEAGEAGNVAGSFLYVLTGLHVMHLIAGMIALIIVFWRALIGKYSVINYNGVRMCAVYWHFMGGLWLYLYLFLLYIR